MFIVNKNVVSESYTDCLAISTSFPVPLLDPQEGKPDVGFRTFTTVGELSGYYSPVCGSPTLQVWDLIFIMLLPSRCSFVFVQLLLCLRMWYIFFCGISFLEKEMATHSSTLAWKIPWM